jgi:hypothetical protein
MIVALMGIGVDEQYYKGSEKGTSLVVLCASRTGRVYLCSDMDTRIKISPKQLPSCACRIGRLIQGSRHREDKRTTGKESPIVASPKKGTPLLVFFTSTASSLVPVIIIGILDECLNLNEVVSVTMVDSHWSEGKHV